ncbi:MAG: hypothetical protein Q7T26_10940 [Dehalococcoidia bacterium]|nr:hypothetical protein [Dehalococcoidia bacterium]
MTQADRISEALRLGALTVAEISAAAGLPPNHVRTVLGRHRGRFVNIQEGQRIGRWGLLASDNSDRAT